jgi:hypothetical protein
LIHIARGTLLAAADRERDEIGARPWPLDPYRLVALRTLDESPVE